MRTAGRRAELAFDGLSIEGGLLAPEWLARVAQLRAESQTEEDYGLPKGRNVRDEIGRAWRVAQAHWADFCLGRAAGADTVGLGMRFVAGMLRESFGFGSIVTVPEVLVGDRSFPVHLVALGARVPIVVAPAEVDRDLDSLSAAFGDAGRRRSPFGLLQDVLNASEDALWGLASDGLTLRIARDNASLTRPAWIEADLTRIFTEERYADFAALWLLAHETRFGKPGALPAECPLEVWRTAGRAEGTRAREHLRQGVERGLATLGQGFLAHPANVALRRALEDGSLNPTEYFQELLRLVYRLIFLLTAEERGVLHGPDASDAARQLYGGGYALRRLRDRSARRSAHDREGDQWEAVKVVCRALAGGEPRLGLPALAGLFSPTQCRELDASRLENRSLLTAVFHLCWLREPAGLSRVNWRDMGPEELGSVYESLLELVPEVVEGGRRFRFAVGAIEGGHSRRTTGSYYTPETLVRLLLDRALSPVLESTVSANPDRAADALLELAIVDPACGSGHFLLAAGRRLAAGVARHRAHGTPSATEFRHALRQVVGRCLFGVDLNPLAVELCKVSLWMEAVEPGRPLSFLDSHIQHGNALLGATEELLAGGIPDAAWEPVDGGDGRVAKALKAQNRLERTELSLDIGGSPAFAYARLGAGARAVDMVTDDSLTDVARKETRWRELVQSEAYDHTRFLCDLWCSAFVWRQAPGTLRDLAPTEGRFRATQTDAGRSPRELRHEVDELQREFHFFHWHLAFPQIFARGGFDVVLGNPPWIAHAGRAAQPLAPGVKKFCKANYTTFAGYPTTHGMFIALAARLLRPGGAVGIIVPSSVSELPKYEPTRAAHDALCDVPDALVDFGEGQFPGVTQPCMALVSRRIDGGRRDDDHGASWPMERPDLDDTARALLARLADLKPLPRELFGERGFQSDAAAQDAFSETSAPHGRFTRALREGTDIREFQRMPPRLYADPTALGGRMRGPEEYEAVRFVVRNTARYPIAAISDGQAFRNSLLAGFESTAWPAAALVALLNSSLIRWQHYMRFRDARQPIMPQVKIGHLRAIPEPSGDAHEAVDRLRAIGDRLTRANAPVTAAARSELDDAVFAMFEVGGEARALVTEWHQRIHNPPGRRGRRPSVETS